MNTDPQQIRAQVDAEVDAALAGLPGAGPEAAGGSVVDDVADIADIAEIDAAGRRLEQAHQILVDALESVEKG